MWGVLLQAKDAAKSLAGSIFRTKQLGFRWILWEQEKIR